MRIVLAAILLAGTITACNSSEAPTDEPVPASAPAAPTTLAPSLPTAEYQRLVDSATYIDYVFFELAFSMSMSEPPAIQYALRGISPEPAAPQQSCPAMGRLFYKIGGRTVREADLHFAPGCTYLAFYEDGAVAYANELSPSGEAFFNNQFRQLLPNYTDIE